MHHRRIFQCQHPQLRVVRHLVPGNHADADIAQHRLTDRLAAADFQHRFGLHPSAVHHFFGEFARGRTFLAHQQALPCHHLDRHHLTLRQRVIAVHRHHQRVSAQHAPHQASILHQL
ncbi:hypothetical protein D3C73_1266950 [compost metagenome]